MTTTIRFNTIRTEYGYLSPLFPSPFTSNSVRWRTLEHYIQGMKTEDLERRQVIRDTPNATIARALGNDTVRTPVRQDWNTPVTADEAVNIASAIQVQQITTKDMVMLEGLIAKYRDNPSLANQLRTTAPAILIFDSTDPHWGGERNMLGRLSMYVRDRVLAVNAAEKDDTGIIFDNLYSLLAGQGYTHIISMGGSRVNLPLSEAPYTDYRGLHIRGNITEEVTVDVTDEETGRERRKKTGKVIEKNIEAIVDVYIQGGYSEERLKEVVGMLTQLRTAQQRARETNRVETEYSYFVVVTLSKQNLNKFLRVATYNNVKFFSPSELFVTPSKHMLNPPVERVSPESPIYEMLRSMEGKLPELDANDKLAKEKGFMPRDIIMVNDFSPHYRIIT